MHIRDADWEPTKKETADLICQHELESELHWTRDQLRQRLDDFRNSRLNSKECWEALGLVWEKRTMSGPAESENLLREAAKCIDSVSEAYEDYWARERYAELRELVFMRWATAFFERFSGRSGQQHLNLISAIAREADCFDAVRRRDSIIFKLATKAASVEQLEDEVSGNDHAAKMNSRIGHLLRLVEFAVAAFALFCIDNPNSSIVVALLVILYNVTTIRSDMASHQLDSWFVFFHRRLLKLEEGLGIPKSYGALLMTRKYATVIDEPVAAHNLAMPLMAILCATAILCWNCFQLARARFGI